MVVLLRTVLFYLFYLSLELEIKESTGSNDV